MSLLQSCMLAVCVCVLIAMNSPAVGAATSVAQAHPAASDDNDGTPDKPLKTINAAPPVLCPATWCNMLAGAYRERVTPARSGETGKPITYEAAPGEPISLRGSDPLTTVWADHPSLANVLCSSLARVRFGSAAYAGRVDERLYGQFNPFVHRFDPSKVARPQADALAQIRRRLEEQRSRMDQTPQGWTSAMLLFRIWPGLTR